MSHADAVGPARDDVPAGVPADVAAMLDRANRLGAVLLVSALFNALVLRRRGAT